jgi:hypothetical protein
MILKKALKALLYSGQGSKGCLTSIRPVHRYGTSSVSTRRFSRQPVCIFKQYIMALIMNKVIETLNNGVRVENSERGVSADLALWSDNPGEKAMGTS